MERFDLPFGCCQSANTSVDAFGAETTTTKWDVFSKRVARPTTGKIAMKLACPRPSCMFYDSSCMVEIHSYDNMNILIKSRWIYAAVYALIALIGYLLIIICPDSIAIF